MTDQATTPNPTTEQTPTPAAPKLGHAAAALKELMDREKTVREVADRNKELENAAKRLQEIESVFSDPQKLLLEAQKRGVSFDDLTLTTVKSGRPDPTLPLVDKISALEAKLAAFEEKGTAHQKQQAMEELRGTVVSFVETSDDFPLVKAAGFSNAVFDHMLDVQARTGELLSEEEAAKQVEEHLSGLVDKLAALEAVKSRFLPQQTKPQIKPSVTLGNGDAAAAPTQVDTSQTIQDRDASLREAVELLRFIEV